MSALSRNQVRRKVRWALLLIVVSVLTFAGPPTAAGREKAPAGNAGLPAPTTPHGIGNIDIFLSQCPTTDPAFAQIWSDFKIRRNGFAVAVPACRDPISTIPVEEYTDELIVLQGLRVAYYMDRGQSGHLPWTLGRTLYDWMKSKIVGIDIRDGSGSSCCEDFGGPTIIVGAQDDFNRDFDRGWRGIAGNIDLYAHETRHVDGFPHDSCCGISNGCDESFDESKLSPYGVQWWLNALWLTGGINVGYACTPGASDDTDWFQVACSGFQMRFCSGKPPDEPRPVEPGGVCSPTCIPAASTLCLQGGRFQATATWRTADGGSGVGQAEPLTADSGYFWFFQPTNVEVLVKVLDACSFDPHKWVFAAGLTNVEVILTVTDLQTGASRSYTNPQGLAFQPIQDTSAFETCP
jgi:hypothetical protein